MRDNDQLFGDLGFIGKPDGQKTVEIGYSIATSARLRGLAT